MPNQSLKLTRLLDARAHLSIVMDSIEYQRFLDELTSTLDADPLVLGLVALGSTADAALRDRWSDHDFWIITSPGSQSRYLDTFS